MCKHCKVTSPYVPSSRVHGKYPIVQFKLCKSCGKEVQGTINIDGSFCEFTTSVYKGGSNVVTLRLSDLQLEQFHSTGKTSREIFELGLEKYKSNSKHLTK